jgi:hypothetical protein
MPSAAFEPAILATKRPHTYALEGAATGIGLLLSGFQNCVGIYYLIHSTYFSYLI